jgi:hypothetical protein
MRKSLLLGYASARMKKKKKVSSITSAEAGRMRWRGTTKAQRQQHARMMLAARWAKEGETGKTDAA